MTRRCSDCGADKTLGEFYARGAKCKDCIIARVKRHRVANIDAVRAYDRERALLPHRIENASRVTREWRRKHRDRLKAHNATARAHMTKPGTCEGCGRDDRPLEKHHPDYSRPLLVIWFCKPCHVIADKIRRKTEVA